MLKEPSNSQSGHMNVESQQKFAVFNKQEAKQACEKSLAAIDAAIDSVVGSTKNATEFEENITRRPVRSFFDRMVGNSTEDKKETPLQKSAVDEDRRVTSESKREPLVQRKNKYGHQKSGVDNCTMITDEDLKEGEIERVPQTTSSKPFLDMIPVMLRRESHESDSKDSKCFDCIRKCVYGFENFCGNCGCLQKFSDEILILLCFVISSIVCLLTGLNIEQNKDVPFSAMVSILYCFVIVLAFDRGCFTLWLERKAMDKNFPAGEEGNLVTTLNDSLCLCSDVDEPMVKRHSRYARPRENTTFLCEVSDVAEMDSTEYPKMKTVIQEEDDDSSSSSGNFSGRSRLVIADVYELPGINTTENYISTCEHDCQGACACPGQK